MESARNILLESEQLHRELRDITQHMTGKLTLGTSRDRASYMMPRILSVFAPQYPDIEFEVFTASNQKLFDALRSGRVDLVLLPNVGQADTQGLGSEQIYSEELVLAAGKGTVPQEDRIREYNAIRSEALDGVPFFLLFQEHAMRTFCNQYFRREKIHPEIRMEFSSNISCFRMAAAGLGYTIIPFLTTKLANPGGETELFSLGKKKETWDVQMFYRRGAYLGTPETDLIRIAKEQFAHESL